MPYFRPLACKHPADRAKGSLRNSQGEERREAQRASAPGERVQVGEGDGLVDGAGNR